MHVITYTMSPTIGDKGASTHQMWLLPLQMLADCISVWETVNEILSCNSSEIF